MTRAETFQAFLHNISSLLKTIMLQNNFFLIITKKKTNGIIADNNQLKIQKF
jgi:hypothetical protein